MSDSSCSACFKDKGHRKFLRRCAGCKTVYYCSEECQRAHWKTHKGPCKIYSGIGDSLKERMNSPIDAVDRSILPDGISANELSERFTKWRKAHTALFRWAAIQALYKPNDVDHIRAHTFWVVARPRTDHGNSRFKYFTITNLMTFSIEELRGRKEFDPTVFDYFQHQKEGRERTSGNRSIIVPVFFICAPLAFMMVPFEVEVTSCVPGMLWRDMEDSWETLVFKLVKDGESFWPHMEKRALKMGISY